MVSFRRLHSHLKHLLNNDLKGTRTEYGFKRAFATLSGQDLETFTGTMFLNMDQLEKQLDNNEFQEIGSMDSFRVLKTQLEFRDKLIQHMESIKKSIDERALHKREYDTRVNERQMQTTEGEIDTCKALDASLVNTASNGTESKEQDIQAAGQQHTEQPEFNNEREVDQNAEQCHDTKIFDSSTTKVDSEPPNGLNEDITNLYECEQTLDVSAGTLNLSAGTSFNPKMEGLGVCSELGIHDHSNEPSSSKVV
ncbi:hypothetical protein Tco_1484630 [Tanacetum coccineum]